MEGVRQELRGRKRVCAEVQADMSGVDSMHSNKSLATAMNRVERLALYGLLALALAADIFLALQLKAPRANTAPRVPVVLGTHLPPLEVATLTGARATIPLRTSKKGTILYVFRPGCAWCRRNRAAFAALAAQVRNDYDVLGVSLTLEGTGEIESSLPSTVATYVAPSKKTIDGYAMAATPTTYLITPTGTLQDVWTGAYTGATKRAIESRFGATLPGQTTSD
jgi:hypothetical protein